MNILEQYVLQIADHGSEQRPGHDPFTVAFHQVFNLEGLGLDHTSHKTSFDNRSEVIECRRQMEAELTAINKRLQDCQTSEEKANKEYQHLKQLFLSNHTSQRQTAAAAAEDGFVT